MQSHTCFFSNNQWQHLNDAPLSQGQYQLALVFADRYLLENKNIFFDLRSSFPNAKIVSCSTAGEIYETTVRDESAVAVVLHLEKTALHFSKANIRSFKDSRSLGKHVAENLPAKDLRYVLVLSDGSKVNGSELVDAIDEHLGERVIVTGGMAGDSARFEKTLVGLDADIAEGNVVLIGFYGDNLRVGYGLKGGWEIFGPERIITKSRQNILYEIDHKNALSLYKKYLGKYSTDLPASALLFPLAIKNNPEEEPIVRTILTIDEEKKTMTFAGNVPQGSAVRLMKANFDKLIFGAEEAAEQANQLMNSIPPQFVLLISCVGRKLALGRRIHEEVEVAADIFPSNTAIAGFYSYGEFSPFQRSVACELHNQTMTITTLAEI